MDAPITRSTIRDTLVKDHRRLEDLILRLLAAFEANDREDVASLWNELDVRLTAHLETEEKFLIPALSRTRQKEADAILAEHEGIRARLLELGAGVDLHIVKLDAAREFVDELRAHAEYEERTLYRWADEHLDEAERASFFTALADALRRPTP